jgi:hypothetical protein
MDKVREFGVENGYDKLTTPLLGADDYTGWEMTAVAEHVLNALGQGNCIWKFVEPALPLPA